ncbi:MAG: hypothetical protein ACLFR8_10370 [Alkalispirochaeta sp.]
MERIPLDRSILTGLRLGGRDPSRALPHNTILDLTVTSVTEGKVLLKGSGVSVWARNEIALRTGERLRVQVLAEGGVFRLAVLQRTGDPRPIDQNTAFRNILTRLGVSDLPEVRALFTAFVASGRSFDPVLFHRALQQSKAIASRRSGSGAADARSSVELSDRDLTVDDFEEGDLTRLLQWFAGDNDGSSREDRHPSQEPSESPTSGERDLRRYLNRTTPTPTEPLHLYNALRPRTGDLHWVVMPIAAMSGETRVPAVMKLGVDPVSARTREAVLSVSTAEGRYLFRWSTTGSVKLIAAGREDGGEVPHELLARLGGTGHTERATAGDGFSLDTAAEDEWTVGDNG